MEVLIDVLRLLAAILIAFAAGKLVARLKLPSAWDIKQVP